MAMLLFLVLGVGGFFGTEIAIGQADDLLGQARVRDGGTLVVGGTPVRLQGLHCPELSEAGGAQAGAMLGRMVAGQQVSCTLNGERTYDRLVGRCHVGGTDLAAVLIRDGLCARCPGHDPPLMLYLPAQIQAGGWPRSMPGYC
jgi:endonuclease YncB( thermonuclease family)